MKSRITLYPKKGDKASLKFFFKGRVARLRGASLHDVLQQLQALCPEGTFRSLWEGRS